jgi:hypothetical protein
MWRTMLALAMSEITEATRGRKLTRTVRVEASEKGTCPQSEDLSFIAAIERPESTGVSKVFPGKRRLKLSRGETQYFRWTQFGIQSLRGCLFLLFGSTLVVKIKKTQESTPSISVMPKKNNRG